MAGKRRQTNENIACSYLFIHVNLGLLLLARYHENHLYSNNFIYGYKNLYFLINVKLFSILKAFQYCNEL